jgi:hypothetical protein
MANTFGRRNKRSLRQVSDKMAALLEELEEARKIVKARDRNRCQALERGHVPQRSCIGPIHVHHIVPRSRSRALYADPSNMVCLCEEHHLGDSGVHRNPVWAQAIDLLDYHPGDVIDD